MRVGDRKPDYLAGRCGYNPELKGRDCNAPATRHHLVEHKGELTTITSCDEHHPKAVELEIDARPVDHACLRPGSIWWRTTPERGGWCEAPDEEEAREQLAVVDLAGVL